MQRRLVAWRAGDESINSLMLQGGELQRARARRLVRTNPYAANASASFTAHAVGCGIKPSSLVEDGVLKDQIQRDCRAWTSSVARWAWPVVLLADGQLGNDLALVIGGVVNAQRCV